MTVREIEYLISIKILIESLREKGDKDAAEEVFYIKEKYIKELEEKYENNKH